MIDEVRTHYNKHTLELLYGPFKDKEESFSQKGLIKTLTPYIHQIVLVQHFGNSSYDKYSEKNKSFRGDLERIPSLTLPFIESIKESIFPGGLVIMSFKNSQYSLSEFENEGNFSIGGGDPRINCFGNVARIMDLKRNVLFEDKNRVLEWNEIYGENIR